MSERTLEQALAHAVIKQEKVRYGLPVHIDEMDIALLANEVLRLRCSRSPYNLCEDTVHCATCEAAKE